MKVWGITDGSAGMRAQVRSLAEACGWELEEKTVRVSAPWSWLPMGAYRLPWLPFLLPNALRGALPEIVISCGRRGAMMALLLRSATFSEVEGSKIPRQARDDNTKYICIGDPRIAPVHFDVVIAMAHDPIEGANVIKTPFALHGISAQKLAIAQAKWAPFFAAYTHPQLAVLLGGTTNKYTLTPQRFASVLHELDAQLAKGYSLLITTSRRTGAQNIAALQAHYKGNGRVYVYAGEGENPYMGMLACADAVMVTNDSVNMMTEAYATGKRLSILPLEGHHNTKPARFSETLFSHSITPQEMMQKVAHSLREMLTGAA